MKLQHKSILGLGLTVLIAPFFLRRRMRAFRRVFIAAPPETVFAYLNDLRNWPLWRSWSRRTESPHFSYSGPATGTGATQHFEARSCRGTLRIVAAERDDHLGYVIDLAQGGKRYEGIFALRQVARGTWVRWIVKWEGQPHAPLRYGDVWRLFQQSRQMTADLEALRRLAETAALSGGFGREPGSGSR